MPKDTTTHSAPRQRPVSCKLCRIRKLRCSREVPCSNCKTRGAHCELESYAVPPSSAATSTTSEPDLVERIRKLEQLVEQQQFQLLSNSNRSLSVETQPTQPIPLGNLSANKNIVSENFETDVVTHAQQTSQRICFAETEHLDKDVAWLESIYTGHDLTVRSDFHAKHQLMLTSSSKTRYQQIKSYLGAVQSSA
jgi:hypothetical protein